MMAYTPGEWRVVGQRQALIADPKLELTIVKPDDRAIAIVLVERGLEDEALDNAALIAAAPDLLAACEAARETAGRYEESIAGFIGDIYDSLPPDQKFSLKETGFFDRLERAKQLRAQLDAAIAKAINDNSDSR